MTDTEQETASRGPRLYGFVRARQLEGTLHQPRGLGVWHITSKRVGRLWGHIGPGDWPSAAQNRDWPPSIPPGLDQRAKAQRDSFYQRVVDLNDCRAALDLRVPVIASFEIDQNWHEAPRGVIPLPRAKDEIVGSHAVSLTSCDDVRRLFKFRNNWGLEWGDGGYGYLPYEYLQQRVLDAYISGRSLVKLDLEGKRGIVAIEWGQQSSVGHIMVHGREWYDASRDENVAWAFVFERHGRLDVEEFFVHPDYRQEGHGRKMLSSLVKLSERTGLTLKFRVPFADIAEENLSVLAGMLKSIDYRLSPARARWAAYEGAQRQRRESFSIGAPLYVPQRPSEPIKTIAAAALVSAALALPAEEDDVPDLALVSKEVYMRVDNTVQPAVAPSGARTANVPVGNAPQTASSGSLVIGSNEFERKNERRFALIQKRNRGGLTADEEAEFQSLQAQILGVTKAAFPHPKIDRDAWLREKERARDTPGAPDE